MATFLVEKSIAWYRLALAKVHVKQDGGVKSTM